MSDGKRPNDRAEGSPPAMAMRRYLVQLVLAEAAIVLLFVIGSHGLSTDNLLKMALALAVICFVGQWIGIVLDRLDAREREVAAPDRN